MRPQCTHVSSVNSRWKKTSTLWAESSRNVTAREFTQLPCRRIIIFPTHWPISSCVSSVSKIWISDRRYPHASACVYTPVLSFFRGEHEKARGSNSGSCSSASRQCSGSDRTVSALFTFRRGSIFPYAYLAAHRQPRLDSRAPADFMIARPWLTSRAHRRCGIPRRARATRASSLCRAAPGSLSLGQVCPSKSTGMTAINLHTAHPSPRFRILSNFRTPRTFALTVAVTISTTVVPFLVTVRIFIGPLVNVLARGTPRSRTNSLQLRLVSHAALGF